MQCTEQNLPKGKTENKLIGTGCHLVVEMDGTGSGSGSGGCDFDPWISVSLSFALSVADIAFSLNLSFVENVDFRNATRLRSGLALVLVFLSQTPLDDAAFS